MVSLLWLIPDLARPLCKRLGWKCCLFLGRCPVMSSSDCRAPDLTISGDKKPCESARVRGDRGGGSEKNRGRFFIADWGLWREEVNGLVG